MKGTGKEALSQPDFDWLRAVQKKMGLGSTWHAQGVRLLCMEECLSQEKTLSFVSLVHGCGAEGERCEVLNSYK